MRPSVRPNRRSLLVPLPTSATLVLATGLVLPPALLFQGIPGVADPRAPARRLCPVREVKSRRALAPPRGDAEDWAARDLFIAVLRLQLDQRSVVRVRGADSLSHSDSYEASRLVCGRGARPAGLCLCRSDVWKRVRRAKCLRVAAKSAVSRFVASSCAPRCCALPLPRGAWRFVSVVCAAQHARRRVVLTLAVPCLPPISLPPSFPCRCAAPHGIPPRCFAAQALHARDVVASPRRAPHAPPRSRRSPPSPPRRRSPPLPLSLPLPRRCAACSTQALRHRVDPL